jgi:hypothetical protein
MLAKWMNDIEWIEQEEEVVINGNQLVQTRWTLETKSHKAAMEAAKKRELKKLENRYFLSAFDEYIEEQIVEVNSVDWSADDRINSAVDLAWRYGGIDGDHHQKWLVDQMLRQILTPDEYNKFVAKYESNGDYKWERGIAP